MEKSTMISPQEPTDKINGNSPERQATITHFDNAMDKQESNETHDAWTETCIRDSNVETEKAEKTLQEQNQPRFKFASLAEIADSPEPSWTIHNVLPDTGTVCIYGPPASGKSFLALDLAYKIATQKDFFGYKIYNAKPVYYISLEGSGGLPRRVKALRKVNETLPDNVKVLSGQQFTFIDGSDIDELKKVIEKGSVIIIDTLNRAMSGMDENSARDMSEAVRQIDDLQKSTNSLVIIIHHTGKDATKGMRGHSCLLGAVDVAISISECGSGKETKCWEIEKSKDGAENIKGYFKLDPVQLHLDEHNNFVTSCVIKEVEKSESEQTGQKSKRMTDNQKLALAAWDEAKSNVEWTLDKNGCSIGRVAKEDFKKIYFMRSPKDKDDTKRKGFDRALIYLMGEKQIRIEDSWLLILDGQPGQKQN